MASTKEYLYYVLEQLNQFNDITYKQMMGEFLLYKDSVLFGGIYDDRLLLKITNTNKEFSMQEEIPYPGAKPMYLCDEIDNKEILMNIILATCKGLKKKNN